MTVVLIIIGVVLLLMVVFFVGGLIYSRRRAHDPGFEQRVMQADEALEAARAQDKGWDKALLEEAARKALASERPDVEYDDLHLVLVDDRPGMEEDRAHLVAMGKGDDSQARVVLTRTKKGDWITERIE
jgi:hypothetical protein